MCRLLRRRSLCSEAFLFANNDDKASIILQDDGECPLGMVTPDWAWAIPLSPLGVILERCPDNPVIHRELKLSEIK